MQRVHELVKNLAEAYLKIANKQAILDEINSKTYDTARHKANSTSFQISSFFNRNTTHVAEAITLHKAASGSDNQDNDLLKELANKFNAKICAIAGKSKPTDLAQKDYDKFIKKLNKEPNKHHFYRMIAMVLRSYSDNTSANLMISTGSTNNNIFGELNVSRELITKYKANQFCIDIETKQQALTPRSPPSYRK